MGAHTDLSRTLRRSMAGWRAWGLVGVVALGAACTSAAAHSNEPVPTTRAAAPSTRAPRATTPRRPAPVAKGAVTFAFGGDVHFEGPLRGLLERDPDSVLAAIAPTLRSSDIAMVNLETAITDRGKPEAKEYTFRAPASALQALTAAGIDVATEANNHGVDFGTDGLRDTLAARAHSPGVHVIGIGRDADDAYAPYRATVHGERIAVIAASQVIDGALESTWTASDTHAGIASAKNLPRLLTAVRAARATSDTVVVFLHWGVEGASCPTATQRSTAAALVAAGADVVIGSHSHTLLGAGHLGSAFVDYGLGNFAFYTGIATGVLTVTMTGRHVDGYRWIPAHILGGVPHRVDGAVASTAIDAWQRLRACTDLSP